jgi:hypothetical protein
MTRECQKKSQFASNSSKGLLCPPYKIFQNSRSDGRKGDSVDNLESVGNGRGPRGILRRTIKILLEKRLTHKRLS